MLLFQFEDIWKCGARISFVTVISGGAQRMRMWMDVRTLNLDYRGLFSSLKLEESFIETFIYALVSVSIPFCAIY